MFRNRSLALALATITAVVLTGCSGGSGKSAAGPTASAGPQATMSTSYGTVTVYTNGNPFDADRALAAIETGYAKARAQVGSRVDSIRIDGMGISIQPGTFNGAVGQYHAGRDLVEMAQGVENVLAHELQHRFCHQLGHSGDCCTYQDHAGGYDLRCEVR